MSQNKTSQNKTSPEQRDPHIRACPRPPAHGPFLSLSDASSPVRPSSDASNTNRLRYCRCPDMVPLGIIGTQAWSSPPQVLQVFRPDPPSNIVNVAPTCYLPVHCSYPDLVGRLNGWSSLNLGWGGIPITPRHGPVLGRLGAQLLTVLIGTNDWGTPSCDVTDRLVSFLGGVRGAEPPGRRLPIVVITLLERRHGHEKRGIGCSGGVRYSIEVCARGGYVPTAQAGGGRSTGVGMAHRSPFPLVSSTRRFVSRLLET